MASRRMGLLERGPSVRYSAALAGPVLATGVALAIGSARTTAAALVYLLSVLAVATAAGLGPGIVASMLSFLGLNFFFTLPRNTFNVAKSDDLIALFVFLSVGVVVSSLVAASLAQRARAERREYETRSLYAISTRLHAGEDLDEAFVGIAEMIRALFALARCEVRTREPDGTIRVRAVAGDPAPAPAIDIPLAAGDRDLGALVLVPRAGSVGEAERRVATILAGQIASSLERALLETEARDARVAGEANRVRRALLSAVSHDFRTPLSSIKTAITALTSGGAMPSDAADELLRTALEETERLERLVSNLLDLTRIRAGAIAPDAKPIAIDDLLDDALSSLRTRLASHALTVRVRDDLPRAVVDPVQTGQVIRNVLENAAKFAPAGTEIRITAGPWHGDVELRVADRGPGVPSDEREAVFEEFYRGGDGRTAGTGLGLAVARALARAPGGDVRLEETPGGGTTAAMRFPAERATA